MKSPHTFSFLGIGSCFNTALGNTSAYYYEESSKYLLLIDCGESIFERLTSKKIFEINEVTNLEIIITHMHTDHVGSLPSLIFYCHYVLNLVPTIIYPDKETMSQYLSLTGCEDNLYKLITPAEHNNFAIQEVKQKHVPALKQSYGYLIHLNSKIIFYSGDSNKIHGNWIDLLLADCIHEFYQDVSLIDTPAHLSIKKLTQLIPEKFRKKVICMHFDSKQTIEIAKANSFSVARISRSH